MVSETPKYLIGAVTKLTGLSIDVVRVWERRYGAVRPARSDGGTRLYSDADVSRLRRLRRAVEKGYSIGQAARLSESELDELVVDADQSALEPSPYRTVRERFIEAVEKLDVVAADQELARAASLFHARELLKEVIVPMLDEINESRAAGRIDAPHARVAVELIRRMLGSLIRFFPPAENAETLVLATPGEESGEAGPAVAALLGAMKGWRVVSLGADVPAVEIAQTVRLTDARSLGLNVHTHSSRVEGELETLSRLLSGSTKVWLRGPAAAKFGMLIQRAGWLLIRDFDHLDEKLTQYRER